MTPFVSTTLPSYSTPLIGRTQEASAVVERLRAPALRLLTIQGASGAGKTRLALQVATMLEADFPAGRVFVSLAPVTDAELVLATVAQTLSIRQTEGATLLETLITAIGDHRLLLILDNIEQVRAAAAEFAPLLAATPHLKLLVTSQVALDAPDEAVFALPPLQVPTQTVRRSADELLAFPAIGLFVSRIQAVQPDFALTSANAGAVAEICARVQGLPLAIELVAAHSTQLQPKDLLFLLRNYLPLPKQPGVLTNRDEILHPLLNWCFSTLDKASQQVFCRLSVFGGGWNLDAALQICQLAGEHQDMRQIHQTLEDHHFVLRTISPITGEHYEMLDAINEYARQHMATSAAQQREVQQRHAQYYLALLETMEQIAGPAEKRRLEREYHNIRAALRWFLDNQEPAFAARLAGNMGFFWYNWGYWTEASRWLREIRPLLDGIEGSLQGVVLKWLGVFTFLQGDSHAAEAFLLDSLQQYRQADDPEGMSAVFNNLGVIAKEQTNYAAAQRYLDESLQLALRLQQTGRIIATMNNLGSLLELQGDYAGALALYQDALERARTTTNSASIALSQLNAGRTLTLLGRPAEALPLLEEALGRFREMENRHFTASVQLAQALTLLEQQDLAGAAANGLAAARIIADINEQTLMAGLLETWARIRVAQGDDLAAIRLLATADAIRARLDAPRSPAEQAQIDRLLSPISARIDPAAVAGAQAEGSALALESALASIIGE